MSVSNSEDRPASGDTLLMVGTRKGALLLWRRPGGERWSRAFHHNGWEVDSLAYDARDGTLFAATTSPVFGSLVQRSRDLGETWERASEGLDYPAEAPHSVQRVWAVQPGPPERPGRVYAGVEHAGLFVSDDGGEHWRGVEALNAHPTAETWQPGAGGLMVHTIANAPDDPARLYVGVSAGGFYRSDDDGQSWRALNRGVRADFLPEPYPESGQCVHRFVIHPARPEVFYQQNHCGVYRSDDGGEHWSDIGAGLPASFGLPIVVAQYDPLTVFVVPLIGPDERVAPDAEMKVWRSRDGGESWEPRSGGLPSPAYFVVLRAAMDTDPAEPEGLYLGTTAGHLFHSADGGGHWGLLADSLARVLSVSTATVI